MLLQSRWRCALALVAIASHAAAQVVLEWDHAPQVPGAIRTGVSKAVPRPDGSWYLITSRLQYSSGAKNWLPIEGVLQRFDAAGVQTGNHTLVAGSSASIGEVAVDSTGGFWASLYSSSATLKRYDANASLQATVMPPSSLLAITGIGIAPSGDLHAGGAGPGFGAAVGSWSPAGLQNFVVTFPQANNVGPICAVSPSGFVAVSRTGGPSPGRIDVVRPDGSVAWSTTIASTTLRLKGLRFTAAHELVAFGEEGSYPALHATVMKWSATGTPSWTHTHFASPSFFHGLAVAADGRIAAVGAWTNNIMTGTTTALVALLDADGTHRWTRSWTLSATSSRHRFDQVLFGASGQIVVGGSAALNTPPLQGQLQSAPVIASWTPTGDLSWQFVGASLHNEEICTALYETSTGSLVYSSRGTNLGFSFAIPESGRFLSIRPESISFCFGDGTGAACPCANEVPLGSGTGCSNSLGQGGLLVSSGVASLTADTLVLSGSAMPATASALYFQGTSRVSGGAGVAFGDGKRCAGGATMRLGSKFNSSGASQYPSVGDPAIHTQGNVTTSGVRTYQVLYRNTATFCTSAPFNLSNAIEILWGP